MNKRWSVEPVGSDDGQWLCIDIGYTYTRFAVWNGNAFAELIRERTIDTRAQYGAQSALRRDAWMRWLVDEVACIRERWPGIVRIGLCFPGIVGSDGAIWRSNSIWGTSDDDLPASDLALAFGLPVMVVNDLAAAAVRYGEDPALTSEQSVVVVSISSGIGAKLYDRYARRVVLEKRGRNGELGLAVVDNDPGALTNANGRLRGILGHYSSGVGFSCMLKRAAIGDPAGFEGSSLREALDAQGQAIEDIDRVPLNELAVAAIKDGDPFTCGVLAKSVSYLAYALHFVVLFNAPDRIVLTGGLAASLGENYRRALCDGLAAQLRLMYELEDIEAMIVMGADDDMDNLIGLATWMEGRPQTAIQSCA